MHRRLVAGTLAGLTLAVAACSSSSSKKASGTSSSVSSSGGSATPAQQLTDGVQSYGKDGSGTVTLSLFGSAADFDALSTSASTAKDVAIANKLIPTSSLALSFEKGSTPSNGSADVDIKINNEDKAVDLVVAKQTIFLRADVKGIGSATGSDTSKLTSEANAIAAELPFVSSLLAGKYVSLDLKSLSGLEKQFGGSTTTVAGGSSSTIASSQVEQILSKLRSALVTDTQITKVGSDSVGDHYQVVVQPKLLAQSLAGSLSSIAGPLSSQLGNVNKDINNIPDKPVTVDAWLSSGKLKQIELDLRQFHQGANPPANPVGIKAELGSEKGSISAPSGATPVDLSKIMGLLGGALSGGSSTTTG
jgi:hypothetical protein